MDMVCTSGRPFVLIQVRVVDAAYSAADEESSGSVDAEGNAGPAGWLSSTRSCEKQDAHREIAVSWFSLNDSSSQ